MKNLFRVLRTLFVVALVVPLALPVIIYIALSFEGVQNWVAHKAERELTSLLGTPVRIGGAEFAPFNRLMLSDVSVADSAGIPVLSVGHLGAGISFSESLWNRRPVITFAEIIDLDLRLERDSVGAPLNIAPIIERFKKKEPGGKSSFNLSVNMVVVRRSRITYNVHSEPFPAEGVFSPHHIEIADLRADLRAPRISDSNFDVEIKRMGATERSGLVLSNLSARALIGMTDATLENLLVEMPRSHIAFDNITIPSPLADDFSPKLISTSVSTLPDSHVDVSDIAPLWQPLGDFDAVIDVEVDASGSLDLMDINRLALSVRQSRTSIILQGSIGNVDRPDSLDIDIDRLGITVNVASALDFLSRSIGDKVPAIARLMPLKAFGQIDLLGAVSASTRDLDFKGSLLTECGDIDIDADLFRESKGKPLQVYGSVSTASFSPGAIVPALAGLQDVTMSAHADLSVAGKNNLQGGVEAMVNSLVWKGSPLTDISAAALFSNGHVDFHASSASSALDFTVEGGHDLIGNNPSTELFAHFRRVDLSLFLDKGKFKDFDVDGALNLSVNGTNPDNLTGWLKLEDLNLTAPDGAVIPVGNIELETGANSSGRLITLDSRPLEARLEGNFTFAQLAAEGRSLVSAVIPSVLPPSGLEVPDSVSANMSIDLRPDSLLSRLFALPVEIIHPATLRASATGNTASMKFDAPFLKQKDKLIESTMLNLAMNRGAGSVVLDATTKVPTKNGLMQLGLLTTGSTDSLDTRVGWKIDREADFHGEINASTLFARNEDGKLVVRADFKPTELVFNDSAWHTNSSVIRYTPGMVSVNNFGAKRAGQTFTVNGIASADSLSRVVFDLNGIDLDYVFETLAISDNVMFGGRATGRLYGDALLSSTPVLYTPRLHVDGLAYNHCVMGDGDIRSRFDNNTKTITIQADVIQKNGRKSIIDGYIRPTTEELVFDFTTDGAPVGFMQPFMSAFTSQVSGSVSGNARLYGTFKNLDLTGDIFVNNLKMKLDFTNTVYEVTDSVHLRPGLITFNDVTLKDRYGNEAQLTGRVTHNFFHDPTFNFDISGARNLLVYDVGEHDTSDPWYGRIFGRGGASVNGVPGRIDIGVKMTTEPKSTFTFVLSDAEESVDYDFITFRDRDKARKDSIAALDPTPLIVRELRNRVNKTPDGPPSEYVMDFNVSITPEATLHLIMDPVGGDEIVAHGSGHLNMAYDSHGELEMRGEYVLNKGVYTFTLQDIIIKDFIIREGSSIKFSGDPYAAKLDIHAAYSTTANLSDLDESFLSDTELNRTSVRVNALLNVSGDMRSPDIDFGLEFPTLTSDIDRKVHSIISTEEMMGQQIIYLLALNRFYTPDYVAATHGNELVSVASSTLSSRLSSMLGQLSDNWNIAPTIRSDRGDFSDVEVDLALSSALLDNRLLFNGNFGYRDKSLNNNSFIGDFDIRYLLNRQGTIQLKAYNRYNDQNYYLKSALTTQGVGIVFKRDFDNVFSFLRPLRKVLKKETTDTIKAPADSIKVKVATDSISVKASPAVSDK